MNKSEIVNKLTSVIDELKTGTSNDKSGIDKLTSVIEYIRQNSNAEPLTIVNMLVEEIRNIGKPKLPALSNFGDIHKNKDSILKYVQENKNQDHIYHFIIGKKFEFGAAKSTQAMFGTVTNKGSFKLETGFHIAGSAALASVIKQFGNTIGVKSRTGIDYQPNDTDIFMLNSPIKQRFDSGNVDVVFVEDKTIDDLLLNFDLPCCRVATNGAGDYWISIQCIYSLLTGIYFIPTYLANYNKFKELIFKYPGDLVGVPAESIDKRSNYLFNRLKDRLFKYSQRGFTHMFYETDVVLPWITHRLDYSEPTALLEEDFLKTYSRH